MFVRRVYLDAAGRVQRPLAPADAEQAVRRLLEEGVEAIAVCLLHAYANPVHERLLKEVIERLAPDLPCAISAAISRSRTVKSSGRIRRASTDAVSRSC